MSEGRGPRGVAIVTGASSTIGGAIARSLAGLGYALALLGRNRQRLDRVAAECRQHGVPALTVGLDLTQPDTFANLPEKLEGALGPLRILVHAAGLFDWAAAADTDPEVSEQLLAVNLAAAMRLTRLTLPALLREPGGSLVFIASMAGKEIFANNAAYVASKHGLVAYARSVFLDVRDRGLKVSAISPGLVAAGAALALDPTLHSRFLRPIDVAEAVRFVVTFPATGCPVEILIEPQQTPVP